MSASDLKLMRCMDELHMQYPFAGSRMMRDLLNRQGHHIGRRHTRTLMFHHKNKGNYYVNHAR